jgi:SAM-dependent methyltransferase
MRLDVSWQVDTFGLCSFEDPAAALQEMERVTKDGGEILLIEHGRGHYDWLNNILDRNSHRHTARWGCIWNRDIEGIVREAGLEVKSMSRWHFGTTYVIVAAPGRRLGDARREQRLREEEEQRRRAAEGTLGRWWGAWWRGAREARAASTPQGVRAT